MADTKPAAHRILIRREAFGSNFDVVIEPPLPDGESFDKDFPTRKAARGYAGGIKMTRGYPIFDLASEEAGE